MATPVATSGASPQTTTEAGTTSKCTRRVAPGRYYLGAYTWKGDEYLGFTATDAFRFGN